MTPREQGQDAADACAAKARRLGFDAEAVAQACMALLRSRGHMSGEAMTDALKDMGHRPHADQAFGSIYARLSRAGLIRCVGYCERAKGHGTAGGRLWAAA